MTAASPTPPASSDVMPATLDIRALADIAHLCEEKGYTFKPYSEERRMWFDRARAITGWNSLPSPAAVAGGVDKDAIVDLINSHLTAVYVCTRVWSAWNVGTMGQDDFVEAAETELPQELADAIVAAVNARPAPVAVAEWVAWSKGDAVGEPGAYWCTTRDYVYELGILTPILSSEMTLPRCWLGHKWLNPDPMRRVIAYLPTPLPAPYTAAGEV